MIPIPEDSPSAPPHPVHPLTMDDSPGEHVPLSESDLDTYDPESGDEGEEEEEMAEPTSSWDPEVLTTSMEELRGEMSASAAEARRGSKRQMEALREFGSLLQSMGEMMRDLHQKSRQEAAPAAASGSAGSELPGEWLQILIDLHDRVARSSGALATPPAGTGSFWPPARAELTAWSQAWKIQTEASGMLLAHLQGLLRRAGLQPVAALGQPFNPETMQAVEVVTDPKIPDHQVIAELLPGWIHSATRRLLRPAQVRVSRQQPSATA